MLNTTQCNLGYNYFAVSIFVYDEAEKLLGSLSVWIFGGTLPTLRQDESHT